MKHADIVAALGLLISDLARDKLAPSEASARLHKLADELAQGTLPHVEDAPARSPQSTEAVKIRDVFDYWRQATGHDAARLLPERAQKIRARLRDFSVRDLCDAIDGCLLSDFHAGDNGSGEKYDWIETIFKTGASVEKHLERKRSSSAARLPGTGNAEVETLRQQYHAAMEAGDVKRANELNRRLRAAVQARVSGRDEA